MFTYAQRQEIIALVNLYYKGLTAIKAGKLGGSIPPNNSGSGGITNETDPVFGASPAKVITSNNISSWNNKQLTNMVILGTTTKTLHLHFADGTELTADLPMNQLISYTGDPLYGADGALTSPRTVDMAGFSLIFKNSGLFRITEGDTNVGSIYDYNDGVDFLNYDANNSCNIRQNATTGSKMSVVRKSDSATLSAIEATPQGLKLTGVPEYADNATAVAAGLSVGYVYRTGDTLKIVH